MDHCSACKNKIYIMKMEGKYVSSVNRLFLQWPNSDPTVFASKCRKLKSHLKQKIFEVTNEIERIKYKTSAIEAAKERDIPIISREREHLLYLTALSIYYKSKINFAKSERKRVESLKAFKEEILAKYSRQNERLNKLRLYSNKKREQMEADYISGNKRREARSNEIVSLIKKYDTYIEAEGRTHFSSQINELSRDIANLENSIQEESKINSELTNCRDELVSRNEILSNEIRKISEDIEKMETESSEEKRKLQEANLDLARKIDKTNRSISETRTESCEIDTIMQCTKTLQPYISNANSYAKLLSQDV